MMAAGSFVPPAERIPAGNITMRPPLRSGKESKEKKVEKRVRIRALRVNLLKRLIARTAPYRALELENLHLRASRDKLVAEKALMMSVNEKLNAKAKDLEGKFSALEKESLELKAALLELKEKLKKEKEKVKKLKGA